MKVKFIGSKDQALNMITFSFSAEKKPAHVAGQFIELYLPHKDKDKRGDKRWFTLSSSPTEEHLSITTRIAAENGSSFKSALKKLVPGEEVHMALPMGDFVLPKDKSIPLVFVAGGIGCTPFRSITKYLADTGEQRNITMIHNVNTAEDLIFKEDFKAYKDNYLKVIGERLTGEKILELTGESDQTRYIYLSGPEPMIEALQDQLKKLGFNKKHIYTDFFPGYTEI